MFMFFLSSDSIEVLKVAYAALAAPMPRLVSMLCQLYFLLTLQYYVYDDAIPRFICLISSYYACLKSGYVFIGI